jgi:DNA-binding NarL/FixJ family response regulator
MIAATRIVTPGEEAAEAVAPRASAPVEPLSPFLLTLVTIDDHAHLRRLYRLAFERSPLLVVGEAADGRAGVEAVRRLQPQMVLLDLSMPDMDGLEALVELRQVAPGARIVVLSGFTKERLGPVVAELGAVDYLEKGIRPDDLLQRMLEASRLPIPSVEPPTPQRLLELRARMAELI